MSFYKSVATGFFPSSFSGKKIHDYANPSAPENEKTYQTYDALREEIKGLILIEEYTEKDNPLELYDSKVKFHMQSNKNESGEEAKSRF